MTSGCTPKAFWNYKYCCKIRSLMLLQRSDISLSTVRNAYIWLKISISCCSLVGDYILCKMTFNHNAPSLRSVSLSKPNGKRETKCMHDSKHFSLCTDSKFLTIFIIGIVTNLSSAALQSTQSFQISFVFWFKGHMKRKFCYLVFQTF